MSKLTAKEKQEHKDKVYAAANDAGVPHKYLHITSTKTVGEIVAAAQKKQAASAKRAQKALQPVTRKAANIVRSLVRQARERLPNAPASAIKHVTSKMTVNQIVNAAHKRMSAKRRKTTKETTRASLKRRLKANNQQITSANIKFTKNARYSGLRAAALKRAAARQKKSNKSAARTTLHQAARQAGISPQYVKPRKGETLSAILRAADKRQGFHTKKNRRAEVKTAIMEVSEPAGITEADIRSAFCVRAK